LGAETSFIAWFLLFYHVVLGVKGARAHPRGLRQTLDACAATWPSPSPGNSAQTEIDMSNMTLCTNDEITATGIREASFEEILDCARRALAKRVRQGTGFTSPRVTADYLRVRLSTLDQEVFCVIYLTKRHQFIACEDLFRGTIDGASVYPREVLKEALKHNAAAVILAHNHPSGVAEPSQADSTLPGS
jgi:DNA repair protein RadC